MCVREPDSEAIYSDLRMFVGAKICDFLTSQLSHTNLTMNCRAHERHARSAIIGHQQQQQQQRPPPPHKPLFAATTTTAATAAAAAAAAAVCSSGHVVALGGRPTATAAARAVGAPACEATSDTPAASSVASHDRLRQYVADVKQGLHSKATVASSQPSSDLLDDCEYACGQEGEHAGGHDEELGAMLASLLADTLDELVSHTNTALLRAGAYELRGRSEMLRYAPAHPPLCHAAALVR